ncbi:glycosyltransferase family 2 protein [bacterium]|nr:glycosyltransferase family 2 protein [bacterium]
MSKISVIIPAYNAELLLPDLISSLELQTEKPLEYILVDDGSSDNTRQAASSFFKVLQTPRNMGPAVARNVAMKAAKGDVFAFIDADCRPRPDWIAQCERLMADTLSSVITGGTFINGTTVLSKAIAALGYPAGGALGFSKMWRVSSEGLVNKISSGNLLIHRSLMDDLGYFDESFDYCFEDAHLAFKIREKGIPIKYASEIDVEHIPMYSFKQFVRWHYARGRGINPFRAKVGKLDSFWKLRLWSTGNIVKAYWKDWKLPLIFFLLATSLLVQKFAAFIDKRK